MAIIVQPHKDLSTSIFQMLLFFLTQLLQLGTEIGVFDSANVVSFHHKAMHLTDGYIPSAAGMVFCGILKRYAGKICMASI
jgi:hypothetical protein